MKLILPIFILTILFSCKNERKISNKNIDFLNKKKDTTYVKKILRNNYPNKDMEEIEIYISNKNDTIINQYKCFPKGILDSVKSRFYNLSVSKTKTKDIYHGEINLRSFADKFKISKNENYFLEFSYWQITKDSTYITTTKVKQKNKISFNYLNIVDDNLSGILILTATNDTIENGEEKIRIRNLEMLVDNKPETNNVFLKSFEFYKNYRFK